MNKKSLIISMTILGVLLLIIAYAIIKLYSDTHIQDYTKNEAYEVVISKYKIVQAVPSDAALVFYSNDFKNAIDELNDSSLVLRSIFTDSGKKNFSKFIASVDKGKDEGKFRKLSSNNTIVSIHYSGNLVPLMIVDAGSSEESDESVKDLMAEADSAKLYSYFLKCSDLVDSKSNLVKNSLILISPSETFIIASKRHLESGSSILQSNCFAQSLAAINGNDAICVSHSYAGRLLNTFCSRRVVANTSFFKDFSEWTSFLLDDVSSKSFGMNGVSVCDEQPTHYYNVIAAAQGGESRIAEFLPNYTISAVALAFGNMDSYLEAYKNYVDATEHLEKYEVANKAFKRRTNFTVEKWIKELEIQEVGKASFKSGESVEEVLLIRIKKHSDILLHGNDYTMKQLKSSPQKYNYQGYAGLAFGDPFSLEDESYSTLIGDWLVVGSEVAVNDYISINKVSNSLYSSLSEAGLSSQLGTKNTTVFAYMSLSDNQDMLKNYFNSNLENTIKTTLNGVAYNPILFNIVIIDGKLRLLYHSARKDIPVKGMENAVLLDTVVVVDKGPFKVKNCATNKINELSQSSNLYISLKDEKGKGVWAIPFNKPICGKVENIDYFGNGKIQFLFAGGSSLHLLDRLGRFVKPFPVDLGKEILLGPAAYDFTGAHGYTVMILFKDNSLAMFDLHGERPKTWKDIKEKDTILRLPELLKLNGKKYWVVRTSRQAVIYPFDGGTAITSYEGGKMIRPDTDIEIKGKNSIIVTCVDGKQRTVKLK